MFLQENPNRIAKWSSKAMKKKSMYGEKPYNRCLSCPHRKVRCDGPRTSGLELARWCEYMRDMKELNGLTNQEIADGADVSVKTVERLMALNADKDILRDTARRIENVIIGSTSTYPCYLAFEEEHRPDEKMVDAMHELERVLADNEDYRAALDNIHTSYKAEMETIRAEAQKKVDFLLDQVAQLRADNNNLWAENNRKSKVIDTFLSKQDFRFVGGKNE